MANLYTVLPGLQPTQQEVVEAELLAKQILEAQYPDLDLREGTGLRDLVLRPNAFLLALVNKGLNYYFAQNTISGINNDTPQEVVDAILSNWFLTRNLGTYAILNVRLYFARQKNTTISSSIYFSPDNSLMYYPQQSLNIPASSMSFDAYLNEWYVDINLQAAQQGTEYNLSQGSLLYFANFDPYFLHAEINYLVSSSIAGETNSQFISRAQTAISTRNLINNPSIISNLQQTFNYLKRVLPIGMGDPEMVRDQVKAVFDAEPARLLEFLESTGTTAKATLNNHGWYTGQVVEITGAIPTIYNGKYSITVISPSQFEYQLLTPATVVTLLPTVQSVTSPVLIHNGGMIDIYCDDSRSNSIVQLTTDENGEAALTGPIFAFSRSSLSGGATDDTIPVEATITYSSATTDQANKVVHVSSTSHGLNNGLPVHLSGLVQTVSISAITCQNLIVTVTSPGHGIAVGQKVVVAGVSPTTYNGEFPVAAVTTNTFTYVVPANILVPGSGSNMVATNPSLTGTYPITVLGPNAFDISIPTMWPSVTTTGVMVIKYDVPYTFRNPNLQEIPILSLTCDGTTVTVTSSKHGLTANRYVTISGITPDAYNGQWLITSVPNPNQFTYEVPANIPSPGTGSGMEFGSVIPWYDYGFSSRQTYIINFGPQYAFQTASFDIDYFTNVDSVQTYLEDPSNRVLCADPLARGFNFYKLDIGVVGYGAITPSSTTVQTVAQTFLESLQPGQIFIMSDLVAALERAGITAIQTPLSVKFTKYTRDLITPVTGIITDYLDPNDRTSVFLLGTVETSSTVV